MKAVRSFVLFRFVSFRSKSILMRLLAPPRRKCTEDSIREFPLPSYNIAPLPCNFIALWFPFTLSWHNIETGATVGWKWKMTQVCCLLNGWWSFSRHRRFPAGYINNATLPLLFLSNFHQSGKTVYSNKRDHVEWYDGSRLREFKSIWPWVGSPSKQCYKI